MKRIPFSCKVHGCNGKAYDGHYCEEHKRTKAASQYKPRTELTRFYDTARWKKARRHQLAIEPLCRKCKVEWATEVDHIIPRSQGGADLDGDNLQSLCLRCHSEKTAVDKNGGGGV